MGLSFKEKRELQNNAKAIREALHGGGINFKEKRELQRKRKSIMDKLKGVVTKVLSPLLDRLLKGEFNNLGLKSFIKVLYDVFIENYHNNEVLPYLGKASIDFIDAHQKTNSWGME